MNITLIGMSGVGKSTIGKLLAKRLGYAFIDVDSIIKEKAGMPLQMLIDTQGDSVLIRLEEEAVLELELKDNCVVSPGGSVIYSEKAMAFLKERSTVIFLDTSLNNIMKRVKDPGKRGIVGYREKSLREIFEERLALYKKYSDLTLKLKAREKNARIVDRILESFEN
ncbi:MAG: shikimate kinase [Methanosarcinaceae archaeon]|nr:shikimate kinase [Methanosarcinaceae archaeon]MDD4331612.1 shikimate kinase [Methanosarcinaceae archaeon]MDD4749233.1 shikimate kinase [Methanosarcinaceae archaeon]